MLLFGLPMRGNWVALLVAMSLFLVGALATGLLISTVADSQQLAFQMALLISFLPTIMLSGFIFPINSMPAALQLITYLVPARYFLVALRGIVLKGTALSASAAAARRAGGLRRRNARPGLAPAGEGAGLTCSACAFSSGRNSSSCGKNPRLFGVVVIAPIVQLTMLGYAATTDVRDVPVVVADGDRSPASRELIARFEGSRELHHHRRRDDHQRGRAVPGERRRVARAVDSNRLRRQRGAGRSGSAAGHRRRQRFEFNHRRARICHQSDRRLRAGTGGREDAGASEPCRHRWRSTPRIRIWFNPQLESRHFMIPGVLALVLLVVTANLASMAIVREKELGTLEQLNVTPLRRWELDRRQAAPLRCRSR